MKHAFWVVANIYGWLLGWPVFETFHRTLLNLSLHGLGYDNGWFDSLTGEERFVKTVLSKHDVGVCFDIGANRGMYSALLATHLPSAHIYAFEPSKATFDRLSSNLARFGSRVTCVQKAVSNETGNATLFSRGPMSGTATLDYRVHEGRKTTSETISMITLDAFVAEHAIERLDFIKIDTEGYEYEVLEGAQKALARYRPSLIQFEFNIMHLTRRRSLFEISTLLPGYTMFRLLPHGMLKIDPKLFGSNIYMFNNVIAIRNDAS